VILDWVQVKPGRRLGLYLCVILIFVFSVLISVARGYALHRLDLLVAASCSGFVGSREQGFIFPSVILLSAHLASGFGLVAAQVCDVLGAGSVFHSLFPVCSRAFVAATPASLGISVPATRDLLPDLFPARSVFAAVPQPAESPTHAPERASVSLPARLCSEFALSLLICAHWIGFSCARGVRGDSLFLRDLSC
jgi:hypothetical protein